MRKDTECLQLMRTSTYLVRVVPEGDRGIEADLAIMLMVDGKDLEAVLVSPKEAGLLPPVAAGPSPHDGRLGEDATAPVWVRSLAGVNGGEGHGVLVVLPKVKVAREPPLDGAVLPDQLDELSALQLVAVVKPAASVHYVVLLQDAQA